MKNSVLGILHRSGAMPAVRALFAGQGAILVFHEIHETVDAELRTGVGVDFFRFLLPWLRQSGWQIVSMDECARRLSTAEPSPRFVTLTFDDGYRDNLTIAMPIMEEHNAPFTIFVPNGATDRSLYSWWLGLREMFLQNETVDIEPMGRRFMCRDVDSKVAALEATSNWIHQDYRRKATLADLFKKVGISLPALNDSYFMDEHELRSLAQSSLATIGSHTVTHPALSLLDDEGVYREMNDNRRYLEGLLQTPVQHFAYPYGNCGAREFAIAARAGFSTAVTSYDIPLTKRACDKHALPRLGVGARHRPENFDTKISGLQVAVKTALSKFGR